MIPIPTSTSSHGAGGVPGEQLGAMRALQGHRMPLSCLPGFQAFSGESIWRFHHSPRVRRDSSLHPGAEAQGLSPALQLVPAPPHFSDWSGMDQ